jgi:adenine-specific DNA-methyltransferase
MRDRKRNGSFYTPKIIADFLVDYLSNKLKERSSISILEPSAGDGVFVKTIFYHNSLSPKVKKFVAVEKNLQELEKITIDIKKKVFSAIHSDFLEYQKNNVSKFSLVIGNPPYIRKRLLMESQVELCKSIHDQANLADIRPINIWTAFLVRCIKFTNYRGILALVLPSELLQVKFAGELRSLILKEFERVEIFTFNELLFKDCKGQDTLILIGERKSENKGIYYCNINKLTDLSVGKYTLAQNINVKDSKWTHHHLETEEIELLERLKQRLNTINYYCSSKAGIVTAANDFFIVDAKTVEEYSLQTFIKPIIQKGIFVNGSVVFTSDEYQELINKSKPAFLLALDKNSAIRRNAKIWDYLEIGKERKIDKRYKTSLRKNWFEIPNIGPAPEAFFFKRCNEYPKFIKNEAGVLSTDSAYIVSMRDNFEIENMIFSFYNSLTLAYSELYGRYYGGGVLELTPNEFKIVPIPYVNLGENEFKGFTNSFRNKISIKEICRMNDVKILRTIDSNIDMVTIDKIFAIREKLFLRRVKTN